MLLSNVDNFIFIDVGPEVLRDEAARIRLASENDADYYIPGHGIPRVPRARWEYAQEAEQSHWLGDKRVAQGDDRNLAHYKRFDSYRALNGRVFSHALEVGSGPFTNLRLIGWGPAKIGAVSLLDPHATSYLSHPGCYFDENFLVTVPASRLFARLWPHLPRPAQRAWGLVSRKRIPVNRLVASSAEGAHAQESYDLVVMINVLEHCMDSVMVLDFLFRSVSPGGVLVLADKTHEDESVRAGLRKIYDAAHPIRVTGRDITSRFKGFSLLFEEHHFDPVSSFLPGTNESYWILQKKMA